MEIRKQIEHRIRIHELMIESFLKQKQTDEDYFSEAYDRVIKISEEIIRELKSILNEDNRTLLTD
jgi:hypothetical protein